MYRILITILIISLIALLFPGSYIMAQDKSVRPTEKSSIKPSSDRPYRDGEVIIKYNDAITREFQSILAQKISVKEKSKRTNKKTSAALYSLKKNTKIKDLSINTSIDDLGLVLLASKTASTEEILAQLQDDDTIAYAEPNYIRTPTFTPNDPYFVDQWAHYSMPGGANIRTTDAWDMEEKSSSHIIVAVIDSGVDHTFPDLAPNMWDGSTGCVSDTGASISCPNHGWDYESGDNDPDDTPHSVDGYQWHGTHIASIIGAVTDNNTGMAGMSRYNTTQIMAIRFGLDIYSEIQAIDFARRNGAKVINASFAGEGFSQAEKDAIDAFPGIFVTAAGNSTANNDTDPIYPCNYTSSNLICVGAYNSDGDLASFSNYGVSAVDIAAPGTEILGIQQDGYWYAGGTSFSTPFVSGTAAILYSHGPCTSTKEIIDLIYDNADTVSSLNGLIASSRKINFANALYAKTSKSSLKQTYSKQIYRFWSDNFKRHFYTIDETEKNHLIQNDQNWRYESGVFCSLPTKISSAKPVYRFWSENFRGHFYTTSESEKNMLITSDPNWRYEGVAYYAFTSQLNGTRPVYRFWSENFRGHFYTTSESEKNMLITSDPNWRYEGIAYYAI